MIRLRREKPQTSAPERLTEAKSPELNMPATDQPRSCHVAALSPVQCAAKEPRPRKEERARMKGRWDGGAGGGGEREREREEGDDDDGDSDGDDDDGSDEVIVPAVRSFSSFSLARSSVKTLTSASRVTDASA